MSLDSVALRNRSQEYVPDPRTTNPEADQWPVSQLKAISSAPARCMLSLSATRKYGSRRKSKKAETEREAEAR